MAKVQTLAGGADIDPKEIITLLAFLLVVIGGIILILKWQAGKALSEIADIPNLIKDKIIAPSDAAITAAAESKITFADFKSDIGYIPNMLITAGQTVAPTSLLERAAREGVDFRESMTADETRRWEEYNSFDRVTMGGVEGVSRTLFDYSIVDAGRRTGDYLREKGWFGY